jgi:hypothetical protein
LDNWGLYVGILLAYIYNFNTVDFHDYIFTGRDQGAVLLNGFVLLFSSVFWPGFPFGIICSFLVSTMSREEGIYGDEPEDRQVNYFTIFYYIAFAWLLVQLLHLEMLISENPAISTITFFVGIYLVLKLSTKTTKRWRTRHLQNKLKVKELLHIYSAEQLDHLLKIEGVKELFIILFTGVVISVFSITLSIFDIHLPSMDPMLMVSMITFKGCLIAWMIYKFSLQDQISVDVEKRNWIGRYMLGEQKQYVREIESIFEEYDDLAANVINDQTNYFDALNTKDRRREKELQQSIYEERKKLLIEQYGEVLAKLILSEKITESTASKVSNGEFSISILKEALSHDISAEQIELIADGQFQVKDIAVARSSGLPPKVTKLYHDGEIDDTQFTELKRHKRSRFISHLASEEITPDEFLLLCDEELKIGFEMKLALLMVGEPSEEKTTVLKTKVKTEYTYLDETSSRRKVKLKLTFDDDILVKISN